MPSASTIRTGRCPNSSTSGSARSKDTTVTPVTFDALDAEIRSVLSPSELITPDDVRGSDPSLGHGIRTRGWPTLGAVRGRILFMLDNENFAPIELRGHPSLRGRILFASSSPGDDDAAVSKLNNPLTQAALIKAALAANMPVRTRADADTVQARSDTPRCATPHSRAVPSS
jgi:hypothetical protein